jgi:hypothetical protein
MAEKATNKTSTTKKKTTGRTTKAAGSSGGTTKTAAAKAASAKAEEAKAAKATEDEAPDETPAAAEKTAAPAKSPLPSNGENLNIAELKQKTIRELCEYAERLGMEGVGGLRKQDLIFKILEGCARRTTTTCRGRTTSTSRPPRSSDSTSGRATSSRGRSGRRRRTSGTSLS